MKQTYITDRSELEEVVEGVVSRAMQTNMREIERCLSDVRELALMQQGILTRNALCQLLGVSVDTIRRYEEKGLVCHRPGRSPLYLLDDVIDFIKQHPDPGLRLAA